MRPLMRSRHLPTGGFSYRLFAGLGIAVASVVILTVFFLWQSRMALHDRAMHDAEATDKIVERYVFSTIHEIDLALQIASNEYGDAIRERRFSDQKFTAYLTELKHKLPGVLDVRATDETGVVRWGEGVNQKKIVNLSDREHFQKARNSDQVVIATPVLARISNQWVVPVSRRLTAPDGQFAGAVYANIPISVITEAFASSVVGAHSAVILFDEATNIRIRQPEPKGPGSALGLKIGSPEFKALWQEGIRSATYRAQSTTDGVWRTYAYRQVSTYPLFLMVGIAEEDALALWYRQLQIAIAALVLFMLLVASLLWSLRRSLQVQRRASSYSRKLIEASLDPLVTISPAGKITDVNHATELVTGLSRTELIGTDFSSCFTDPDAALKAYQKVFSDGSIVDYPLAIRHASGRITDVLYNATIYRNEAGDVEGVFAAARDVTALKLAERELSAYRQHLESLVEKRTAELAKTETKATFILESSADGLYGVDEKGIVTFINPAACALLGYRSEEVIGKSAHALFHHRKPDGQPYPESECQAHQALISGEEKRIDDEVYWRADGQALPVMYAVYPIVQDGHISGAVTSFVDMSEQRAAAEAREQALLVAENLARVRREFLANMSHELRTPLNGVLGFAEIGLRNYQNAEKARDAFETIQTTGKRLLGVINDVLDFSRIEAGRLNIELLQVSLPELIDQTVDVVREKARAKNLDLVVNLSPDLPAVCISDPLRLGQVLLNLISNAVKFTETGSVALNVSLVEGMLVFSVRDTGIGMNQEQVKQLFNPFQQADASNSRRYGGSGLGLAISKRILELMGGDIRVVSQPGVGSTLEFRVPYVDPSKRDLNPTDQISELPPLPTKPLADISILVAEDEPINQVVITENLLEDGANVELVSNGAEAVDRIIRDGRHYDVVLMDIQMPEMDGFEATRLILRHNPVLPIIGQTAHALKEERDKCLDAGMVAHISKPIDSEALVRLILNHV